MQLLLLSQQIFFILLNSPDKSLDDKWVNAISEIAANIQELGTLHFYADKGFSLNNFNNLGDEIVKEVNVLKNRLLTKSDSA